MTEQRNNGLNDDQLPARASDRVSDSNDDQLPSCWNPLDLMRESTALQDNRQPSASGASILGDFSLTETPAPKVGVTALTGDAATRIFAATAQAPATDSFAQAPPAGGAETGGFNPAMFGD